MIEIREATLADADPIIAMEAVPRRDLARARSIQLRIASGSCLVAERNGQLIGYGALDYSFFDNGFISILYVSENERCRGVGRILLESLASRCRTRKLFTSTNRSNLPMQHLLESLGYVRSGVIHHLDPDDPELVYFLDRGERAP